MKRAPLLADLALTDKCRYVSKEDRSAVTNALMKAKRFVFDEKAALFVAEMVRDMPRIIADANDFAIPPFHSMYIEYPSQMYWETVTGRNADDSADHRVGYLIVGNVVRVLSGGNPEIFNDPAVCTPVYYHLNHPLSYEEEWALCMKLETSRAQLDSFYWGSSYEKLGEDADESRRVLRANHGFHIMSGLEEHTKRLWKDIMWGAGGEMRNIISFLLFLNRTRDLQVEREVGPKQQFIGNKLRPLLKHTVITMDLNPKPRLMKLVAGDGVWRRLHDVRGHFCHNKQARESGCQHEEWEEYEPMRWRCTKCSGLRWWRKEHRRGHEEKGEVTSEYRITSSNN